MIESYIDKGAITSLIAEATRPEIGQPVAAASLFKVEEGAQYFVERAAYVTDGTESEEKRAFAPYEAFQVRVTFRANEGSRFAGQLFFDQLYVALVYVPDDKSCSTSLQGHAAHYSAYARCSTGYKHICTIESHSFISITGANIPSRVCAGVRE